MPSTPSRASSRSSSPTPTLVDPPSPTRRSRLGLHLEKNSLKSPYKHCHSPTSSVASSQLTVASNRTRHSIDSIWDFDFEAHWERRQREDATRLAELKGTVPYLTFGRYEEELERVKQEEKARRRVHGFSEDGGSEMAVSRGPSAIGAAENNHAGGASDAGSLNSKQDKKKGLLAKIDDNRRMLRKHMRKKRFHLVMIGLVAFDLLIVMVELIVGTSNTLASLLLHCWRPSDTDAPCESISSSDCGMCQRGDLRVGEDCSLSTLGYPLLILIDPRSTGLAQYRTRP